MCILGSCDTKYDPNFQKEETGDKDSFSCKSDADSTQSESDCSTEPESYLVSIVRQTRKVADEHMASARNSLRLTCKKLFPLQDDETTDYINHFNKTIEYYNTLLDTIEKETKKFANNSIPLSDFIFKILVTRYNVINITQKSSTSRLQAQVKDGSPLALFDDLPTNGMLLEAILKNDPLFYDCWYNRGLREHHDLRSGYSVVVFQICNLLIKEVLSTYNFDTYNQILCPGTMHFLRASRKLHPILAGKQQDLGTPDDACSSWGLLKPILLSHYGYGNENDNSIEGLAAIRKQLDLKKAIIYDDREEKFRCASLLPQYGLIHHKLDVIRNLPLLE